jgi:hypothetical protein
MDMNHKAINKHKAIQKFKKISNKIMWGLFWDQLYVWVVWLAFLLAVAALLINLFD